MIKLKNKNGYTIPELFIVILIVGVIMAVGISKVSYAYENINQTEEQQQELEALVKQASIAYAETKKEEFKKEPETYIYAKEVAMAGFLFEKEEYNSMKIKLTYNQQKDSFTAEVVK